ncbi:WD40 repeat-like protein [Cylindrobasidium torrendii FP15055 ss-10]|uniref:Protein HIR n=1 Tax=Cylindrobasidium torrendii FP15055 ss-10 TaxID=1314674 RepID=A0A0D7B1L3_9AGAR|nr:WD40 repeat-like protein [Cylindrobasidium torrendii FP15055 ss-10]
MRYTKPAWVAHNEPGRDTTESGEPMQPKRLSIFSVHVHPDGSRIATGGLDAKIRVWSTKPILNEQSDASNKPPKSLCTLTMHTGPVLCVRWAHSGRWLASGSDDEVVMIWDLDRTGGGKVWGSDEVNVEGWKPLKRLPGHESDVTDVAWAPKDRYLASVGLDSNIIVWCGYTLERLHKLDQHQGFVKGVCWDPVGEFLATQSDDRSVKIWRTRDWGLEAEVTKPFEDSPTSTFFRRLSWSPDGAHITASNATNNEGYVFIAAVITRNTWASDISLVGHENTVEVAAYNPHIFLRNPEQPMATANICSVVALGADDRSVSVWQTKSARPLIVAKEVFDRQIMDLNWSWDGLTLYAASSDGTLAVFHFEPEELEGIAPHSAQDQYLAKFGFVPPPLPSGYSHTPIHAPSNDNTQLNGGAVNVLVAKKNTNKGRRRPKANGFDIPSASHNGFGNQSDSSFNSPLAFGSSSAPKSFRSEPMAVDAGPSNSFFPAPDEQPFAEWPPTDVPMSAPESKQAGAKTHFRTLGGDKPRESIPIREITTSQGSAGSSSTSLNLPVPPVLSRVTVDVEGHPGEIFEGTYDEAAGVIEVRMVTSKQTTAWLDYLPSPVLAAKATRTFAAAATYDGCVYVYSHNGRRLMPNMCLGSPCTLVDGANDSLLVITSAGQLYSWDVAKQTAHFPPVSLSTILTNNVTLTTAAICPNGSPVLNCSNGVVYTYDAALCTFVKLTERWWAEGSDTWTGRQRASSTLNGIINTIEGSLAGPLDERAAETPRPQWWDTALTLGHLESRIHAARLLESPNEYRQALLLYSKKIADEGFRQKAEELIKELAGPIYWRPGQTMEWEATVVGMGKRDLLKEVVLGQFARSKTLSKLATEWQDLLKRMASDS